MGKKKAAVEEKRKAVKVRPIERKHAGKVTEPYRLMEELVKAHHPELEAAKILLLWRKGWKPDVDKVLKLGSMKKAGELERAISAMIGDNYDFAMQLNEDAWSGLSDDRKRHIIDHELCHAAPDLDRDGQQKLDAKERLCWRTRKHPIQEFPEILDRYGAEIVLGLNAAAQKAVEDADRPLIAAAEQAARGKAGPVDWRALEVDELFNFSDRITERHLKSLRTSKIETLGELADLIDNKLTWWHREVRGIGKDTAAPVEDALAAVRQHYETPKAA